MLAWAMQELDHQKQAIQATHGAVAESTQRNKLSNTFRSPRLCGELFTLWPG
jgi:hypothetical protein